MPARAPRRRRAALVLLLVWLALVAPSPALAAGAGPGSGAEQGLLVRLDGERDRAGVRPVAPAPDLAGLARRHAREMAQRQQVFHDPAVRDEATGWELLGESTGAGPDAAALHSAFLADGPSRQTMLDPRWQEVGLGAAESADGTLYVAVLYRQPSARPLGAPADAAGAPGPAPSPDPAPSRDPAAARAELTGAPAPGRPSAAASAPRAAGPTRAPGPAAAALPALPPGADLATRVRAVREAAVPGADPVATALSWAARMALLAPAG